MKIKNVIDLLIQIKETIQEGERVDSKQYNIYPVTIAFQEESCEKLKEMVDTAIPILEKYQQIQEIIGDRYGKPTFKFMDAIIKVVEDGNNSR